MRILGLEIKLASKIAGTAPSNPDPYLIQLFGGAGTASGIAVSEHTALQVADVYKCVRVLAETVAMLPLKVYKQLERGKEVAKNHPIYSLVHDAPNDNMTSFTFREAVMGHITLWGNSYNYIERNAGGQIVALWPLPPHCTRPKRVDGKLMYVSVPYDGPEVAFFPDEILHIPGLSYDGICGYSPIALQREAFGFSKATEKFGARFFGNSSRPDGVLEHPAVLKPEAVQRLKESWQQVQSGDNHHRLAVLEQGMTWKAISIDPDHAQFLETRKFQRSEIAGMFRVPPHMIGDLERSTHSNIEQQHLEFYTDTIMPWLERFEQECNRKLFTAREQNKYFVEFEVKGFLRGDTAARTAHYKEMFYVGVYSPNDIHDMENMNPTSDGDTYYVPLNMVPADELRQLLQANPTANSQAPANLAVLSERLQLAYRRIFRDAVGRIMRREPAERAKYAPTALLQPLLALSEAINGRETKENKAFVDQNHAFVEEYARDVGQRAASWTAAEADAITVSELNQATKALFERGFSA